MTDNETFAPVLIPTLCRYDHFKRCVESLARCTHADKTELIVALDYPARDEHREGHRKISEYIPTITGFKQVTLISREANYGAVRNSRALVDYAFDTYDRIITTEDDNEFSPCFLDFMNKCLCHYADNPSVMTVSGYSQEGCHDKDNGMIFTQDTSAWGFGRWKHKEMAFRKMCDENRMKVVLSSRKTGFAVLKAFPACLQMYMNMLCRGKNYGDTKYTMTNILNGTYQVRPSLSMVRNWGNDGTGEHCKTIDERFASQEIDTTATFPHDMIQQIAMSRHVSRAQFYIGLPRPRLLAWAKIVKITLRYLLVRKKLLKK